MSKQRIIKPGDKADRVEALERAVSLLMRDMQNAWQAYQQQAIVLDSVIDVVGIPAVQAAADKRIAAMAEAQKAKAAQAAEQPKLVEP